MQDFTRKFAIVVRKDLPSWQAMNTVAHCAAYLANKMGADFYTGESFTTRDGATHPRNTQYTIVVLGAGAGDLNKLMPEARASGLPYLGFIREMIETTDDAEIEKILAGKSDDEIEYLGIGLFGEKEKVDALTKRFSLWK